MSGHLGAGPFQPCENALWAASQLRVPLGVTVSGSSSLWSHLHSRSLPWATLCLLSQTLSQNPMEGPCSSSVVAGGPHHHPTETLAALGPQAGSLPQSTGSLCSTCSSCPVNWGLGVDPISTLLCPPCNTQEALSRANQHPLGRGSCCEL